MADDYAGIDMEDVSKVSAAGLAVQDLKTLDASKIGPDSHEVISRQATINIGTIGHVAHGKSSVVNAISSVKTTKFKDEARRNITIHLGYANAKIFKSEDLPEPQCYKSFQSSQPDVTICSETKKPMTLVRHVSFVDCPGHDILMSTMLNGAAVMDAALLLIAANEPFPQPQTLEHLKAVEIMKLKHVIVVQNKIDLVSESEANAQKSQISTYFSNTVNLTCPIIPISAQARINIDYLLQYISHIPYPPRQLQCPALMTVVRSFDTNKPGGIENLSGGVAGGTILKGILKRGSEIEVRPGRRFERKCCPIISTVRTLQSESNALEFAVPGGLVAVGTNLDPSLTRQNKLVGQMIGERGSLPPVYSHIAVEYNLLPHHVGSKKTSNSKVLPLAVKEHLQLNIGTLSVYAVITQCVKHGQKQRVEFALDDLGCCNIGDMVTLSRRYDQHNRLIGWGKVIAGHAVEMLEPFTAPKKK